MLYDCRVIQWGIRGLSESAFSPGYNLFTFAPRLLCKLSPSHIRLPLLTGSALRPSAIALLEFRPTDSLKVSSLPYSPTLISLACWKWLINYLRPPLLWPSNDAYTIISPLGPCISSFETLLPMKMKP